MGKKKSDVTAPAGAPFAPVESPCRVPFDGRFRMGDVATKPPSDATKTETGEKKKKYRKALEEQVEAIYELQRRLYAQDRHSLLLVFQAMDAAGKDSTIRAVMTGINPAGCQVFSFKRPSQEELDHDFLWRIAKRMPEQGRIGIFNRSHYEEVLVVRVQPELLAFQKLPRIHEGIWDERFESIRDFERHHARNGTVMLKFFLHVSKAEQRRRLIARIDDESKNWKFEAGDLQTRSRWDEYMAAYEDVLNQTSRPWAPWYAVPADNKPFMRLTVARIVRTQLDALGLRYPVLDAKARAALQEHRAVLDRDRK